MTPPGPHKMYAPPELPEGNASGWLVTWADAITVLLGFFVLLFSLSKIDQDKISALQAALGHEQKVAEPLPTTDAETRTGPELAKRISEVLAPPVFTGERRVEQLPAGVAVELHGDDLFTDEGTLREEVVEVLATFAWEIKQPDMVDYMIEVQAFDDWEDSGTRSLALTRFLNDQGVPPARLRSTAFGSLNPTLRPDRGQVFGPAGGPTVRVLLERP